MGEALLREAHAMDRVAEKAIECFKMIEKKHGVWDIFLEHYLQVNDKNISVLGL